jgi:anti-anti-sigma factor
VTYPAADGVLGLSLSARTECGYVIAALSGELDIASAPALRDQLLGLLTPATSRLIIDLSAVSYADASGLTVLVGTGRRAGLLGGHLRLAAPPPEVARVLSLTGLDQHFDISPTVHAAMTSPPRSQRGMTPERARKPAPEPPGTADAQPAAGRTRPSRQAADDGELRLAIAAVLLHGDAWRDADPRRQFAPALHDLAQAYAGTSQGVLTRAAHALLSVLTRQPLTHSPAVAATASRLRRLLDPGTRPAPS